MLEKEGVVSWYDLSLNLPLSDSAKTSLAMSPCSFSLVSCLSFPGELRSLCLAVVRGSGPCTAPCSLASETKVIQGISKMDKPMPAHGPGPQERRKCLLQSWSAMESEVPIHWGWSSGWSGGVWAVRTVLAIPAWNGNSQRLTCILASWHTLARSRRISWELQQLCKV